MRDEYSNIVRDRVLLEDQYFGSAFAHHLQTDDYGISYARFCSKVFEFFRLDTPTFAYSCSTQLTLLAMLLHAIKFRDYAWLVDCFLRQEAISATTALLQRPRANGSRPDVVGLLDSLQTIRVALPNTHSTWDSTMEGYDDASNDDRVSAAVVANLILNTPILETLFAILTGYAPTHFSFT